MSARRARPIGRRELDWLRTPDPAAPEGARAVAVGANFRYGRKAAGDADSLRADGRFETLVVPLVEDAGGVVSSRRLREAVGGANAE